MKEAAAPLGNGGLEGADSPDQWKRNDKPTDGP